MESKTSQLLIDSKACPTKQVTVYCDRAEVTRYITFTPSQAGTLSLLVAGLTETVDPESIRVKCVSVPVEKNEGEDRNEGKHSEKKEDEDSESTPSPPSLTTAECTILEVSFDINFRPRDVKKSSEREAKARAALADAKTKITECIAQLNRVNQQDQLVNGYLKSMLSSTTTPGNGNGSATVMQPPCGTDLETVAKLLDFHTQQGADIDQRKQAIKRALDAESKAEAAAMAELQQLSAEISSAQRPHRSRDVTILIDTPETESDTPPSPITLSLTYLVRNASWVPSYDCRVANLDEAKASMALTYFGVVKQSSGEDWKNVPLILSTAAPATGGNPPFPTTLQARWQQARPQFSGAVEMSNVRMPMQSAMHSRARMARRTSINACEADMSDDEDEDEVEEKGVPMLTSVKQSAGGSATFAIDRPCTVESDNKEHKVTIAIIPLKPQVRHFCVPSLEQAAYLQTTTTNTSPYPFLPSKSVSVFIEGSYLTKSELKHTSPGQSFVLFLGVDQTVKVEHKTLKDERQQGKDSKFMTSATPSSLVKEYRTLLHNTKSSPITITVVELMPRSSDRNIEIKLLQPPRDAVPVTGKDGTNSSGEGELKVGGCKQNKVTNNLVFLRRLEGQSKLELPFSYSIQWPHDRQNVEVV